MAQACRQDSRLFLEGKKSTHGLLNIVFWLTSAVLGAESAAPSADVVVPSAAQLMRLQTDAVKCLTCLSTSCHSSWRTSLPLWILTRKCGSFMSGSEGDSLSSPCVEMYHSCRSPFFGSQGCLCLKTQYIIPYCWFPAAVPPGLPRLSSTMTENQYSCSACPRRCPPHEPLGLCFLVVVWFCCTSSSEVSISASAVPPGLSLLMNNSRLLAGNNPLFSNPVTSSCIYPSYWPHFEHCCILITENVL